MDSAARGRASLRAGLDVMASVALIVAAVILVFRLLFPSSGAVQPELDVPREPLTIAGAPAQGADGATALMMIFADFQCPFCGRFAREVLPEIERRYVASGRVTLVFHHLPLPIHPMAVQAAVVAECAKEQGRFWETHDHLFAVAELSEERLQEVGRVVGLDTGELSRCISDSATVARVEALAAEANALGIRGTPAFFLGTRLEDGRMMVTRAIAGARPIEEFIGALETTLAWETTRWDWWIQFLRMSG